MKKFNQVITISLTALSLLSIPLFANQNRTDNADNKGAEKKSDIADASAEAGKYYEQGKKLYDQRNYKEAFPLLLKAAEMGHSDAQMHVGKMYYNGWGVGHSHEKGKEWHQKAAKQGNKESIQKLYNMEHKSGSAH